MSYRQEMQRTHPNHVVVFPSAGMGHFIPMLEFAKRLSACHHFSVTFITTDWHVPPDVLSKYKRRFSSKKHVDVRFLQLPPTKAPEHITDISERLAAFQDLTLPLLKETLLSELQSGPIAAFITDFFCGPFFNIALELDLPVYVFFVSSASLLCLMLYAPTLSQSIGFPLRDLERTIDVPGLPPMPAKDLPRTFSEDSLWKWFSRYAYSLPKARGFLVNTFRDLEELQLETLQQGKVVDMEGEAKEYYAVGPLIQSSLFEEVDDVENEREECLLWLDMQPAKSVLYVSFGSSSQLSLEQVVELAHGLEMSGQRFLWVLQKPQLPPILQVEQPKDGMGFLPDGFISRTQERGLVYTKWAPQVAILSHPSTAGFLTHCGWNSTLEAVLCGAPLLTWPQAAEQRMNELLLVERMKVGVNLRREEGGVVRRDDIEKGVKELMRNEEVKETMKMLSKAANLAMAEGGSSLESLGAAASVWKSEA